MKTGLLFGFIISFASFIGFPDASAQDIIYEYDELGRLVKTVQSGKRVAYEYDAAGNRTSLVIASNNAPNAVNDSHTMDVSTTYDLDVLSNDTDADGDTLVITAENSSFASLVNNKLRFNAPGTAGTHTVTYTISDGSGGSDTANAVFTVEAPTIYVTTSTGYAVSPYVQTSQQIQFGFWLIKIWEPDQSSLIYAWTTQTGCTTSGGAPSGYSFTGNGCELTKD